MFYNKGAQSAEFVLKRSEKGAESKAAFIYVRNTLNCAEMFFLCLSHYSPHEIIAPHNGVFTMIGGAIGYLTTELGGYNGKDPFFSVDSAPFFSIFRAISTNFT